MNYQFALTYVDIIFSYDSQIFKDEKYLKDC